MTRDADHLRVGDRIHIEPHDVFRGSDSPHHIKRDAKVTVAAAFPAGSLIVVCWRGSGTIRGVCVYDWNTPVELVGAA